MPTDFDTVIDRRDTSCLKYDFAVERGYPQGILPFWVADMDFSTPQPVIAVAGSSKVYPVRRIWCVGRNYIEHIREMGQDERLPPFYFAKPADAIVADGSTVPYPSLTKDMHHEVELVVALKSGGVDFSQKKRRPLEGEHPSSGLAEYLAEQGCRLLFGERLELRCFLRIAEPGCNRASPRPPRPGA